MAMHSVAPRSWGSRARPLFIVVVVLVLLSLAAAWVVAAVNTVSSRSEATLQTGAPEAAAPAVDSAAGAAKAGVTSLAAVAPSNGAAASATNAQTAQTVPNVVPGQMLIRTATLVVESPDALTVVARIHQIAESSVAGADIGYVSDEQTRLVGDAMTASVTINVPAATFNSVMQQLRGLGTKVISENSSSQDVSAQYVDIDAQLQALKATQAQLLQLLARANTVAETLAVQTQLTQVQTQINQLQGRENYLQHHSAFSTIVVSIQPPSLATKLKPEQWSPLATLTKALSAFGIFGQRLVDGFIYLVIFVGPFAIIGGGIWWLVRRARLGRRTPPVTPAAPMP